MGHLEQSFVSKSLSRVRFQVEFEFQGPAFVFEGAIEFDLPGSKSLGMNAATLIMGQKSLLKIRSEANVGLFRVAFAPKDVNVKHAHASFRFTQLRRARFAAALDLGPHTVFGSQRGLPRVAPRSPNVACHA